LAEEHERLANDVVEREWRLFGHAPRCHAANAGDDVGRPPCIGDHAHYEFPRLADIGRRASQPAQAGFTARGNRCQRLIDLMGDRGSELASIEMRAA
jgi:hypothetical protein